MRSDGALSVEGDADLVLVGRRGGVVAFSSCVWMRVLEIARAGGWEPAGTQETPSGISSMEYISGEGQLIAAADAAALAVHLQAATDLPAYLREALESLLQSGAVRICDC